MALVNILRFDGHRGAVVSDEEYWNVWWRKRLHSDNLHVLLDEEMSRAWGLHAIYGSVGYPSLHREVVVHTKAALAARFAEAGEHTPLLVRDVARLAFEHLQACVRRRIDQKLFFYYGFRTDDLNRGYFMRDGRKVEIKNKKVKEEARKLAKGETRDLLQKQVMECKAAVFGHDQEYGITAYHLAAEKSICGYVHEEFELIGTGKYASGLSLGQHFKTRNVEMRRKGYTDEEGLFELFKSAILAGDHFKEVGGTYHLILLDGAKKKFTAACREIYDDVPHLATEIVRAQLGGLLTREKAIELLRKLVVEGLSHKQTERLLFDAVKNREGLELLLRGYKVEEVKLLCRPRKAAKPAKGGAGR